MLCCLTEIGASFGVLFKITEERLGLFCVGIYPPPTPSTGVIYPVDSAIHFL